MLFFRSLAEISLLYGKSINGGLRKVMLLAPKGFRSFTLCSVQDRSSLVRLIGGLRNLVLIDISDAGERQCSEMEDEAHAVYFGKIQFAGSLEPYSGKSGMELVPHCIVYNGQCNSFMESFSHYKDHPDLHGLTALFVEQGSALRFSGEQVLIVRGHLATVKAAANPLSPQAFDIQQFGGSENLVLDSASLLPGGQTGARGDSEPEGSS
jgi:hypothetical protein